MSRSGQSPRNGLAKLLWEADRHDPPDEIIDKKERFECPVCGWTAELRRKECMVCEFDSELQAVTTAKEDNGVSL